MKCTVVLCWYNVEPHSMTSSDRMIKYSYVRFQTQLVQIAYLFTSRGQQAGIRSNSDGLPVFRLCLALCLLCWYAARCLFLSPLPGHLTSIHKGSPQRWPCHFVMFPHWHSAPCLSGQAMGGVGKVSPCHNLFMSARTGQGSTLHGHQLGSRVIRQYWS